jgi:RNA polymerase-binding transcription factor DksA
LNADQRARLREELERELRRLVPDAARASHVSFAEALAQTLGPRPRSYALQILDALRRLDDETFGSCAGCGGTISFERLSAIPETTVCAECSWNRELSFAGKERAT